MTSAAPAAKPRSYLHPFADARILLPAITALGLLLRCLFLGSKSFWMDEGFSAYMARADYPSFLNFVRHGEINMAAYYVLLRLWTHWSVGESFIRLLSVIASAATIPLVYLVGKWLFTPRAGLIAAALLAVHPGHIEYAQEARSYALAVFLVCLTSLFLLRCLSQDRPRDYAFFCGAAVLAIYSHILAALIPLAQSPAALRRLPTRSWRPFALACLCGALLLLPAAFIVWTTGSSSAQWIPPLSLHMLLRVWWLLTVGKFGWIYLLAWLAALWNGSRYARSEQRWALAFLLCWLLLPFAFLFAISIFKPLLVPRFLLFCVPAAALLAAQGVNSFHRPSNWLLFALIVAASLAGVRSYYRRPKPDWRGAAAQIFSQSRSGDAVLVTPAYGHFTLDYYRQLAGVSSDRLPYAAAGGQIEPNHAQASRLWLVVYGGQGANQPARQAILSLDAASRNQYCPTRSWQFSFLELFLVQSRSMDGQCGK